MGSPPIGFAPESLTIRHLQHFNKLIVSWSLKTVTFAEENPTSLWVALQMCSGEGHKLDYTAPPRLPTRGTHTSCTWRTGGVQLLASVNDTTHLEEPQMLALTSESLAWSHIKQHLVGSLI